MSVLRLRRALSPLMLLLLAVIAQARAEEPAPRLDVPYVPTPAPVVARMLEMAGVHAGDYVIDLGSGDGRIPIAAVLDHGARGALGIDLNPLRIEEAERNARQAGVTDRVRFEQGDLFEKDISAASVLTLYLLPKVNLRLRPVILETLEPGTRVVSHAFSMGDWEADQSALVNGSYVYLWVVPARVAGRWVIESGGDDFTVDLHQQFQKIEGTLVDAPGAQLLTGTLRGDQLQFAIGERLYVGQVQGDRIRAVAMSGATANWSARRY